MGRQLYTSFVLQIYVGQSQKDAALNAIYMENKNLAGGVFLATYDG
jgi:hypothetical protein